MKKLILNLSDSTFEKLRLEAIKQKKSISDILANRIMFRPFDSDIEEEYQRWIDSEIEKIIGV